VITPEHRFLFWPLTLRDLPYTLSIGKNRFGVIMFTPFLAT